MALSRALCRYGCISVAPAVVLPLRFDVGVASPYGPGRSARFSPDSTLFTGSASASDARTYGPVYSIGFNDTVRWRNSKRLNFRACYELWAGSFGSGCGGGGSSLERTRTPVGTPSWLWVNLAAMGLSLGHTVADLGIIFGSLSSGFGVPQSLLSVLIAVLYSWWAWAFAKAVGGAKSWLVGLMVFDVLWVGGNGLTIFECPPPCSAVPF